MYVDYKTDAGTSCVNIVFSEFTVRESMGECECCMMGHMISSHFPRVYCKLCGHPYKKKDGRPVYCTWPESHRINLEGQEK